MKNKDLRSSKTAKIYEREFQMLEQVMEVQANTALSREDLLKEYIELGSHYERLLKKTIKITRVGDSNQRRLLIANEQIETQKEELSIAYQQLDLVARTDPLTNISNRRDFLEKFNMEIRNFEEKGTPLTILLMDIDNFKDINDTYGHDTGDFILKEIARLLKSNTRHGDIVARWGGEEFILLLPSASLEGGSRVAQQIRKTIQEEKFVFKNRQHHITITFGVSQFKDDADIDSCIKDADEALYIGKEQGKNRVITAPVSKNSTKNDTDI